jgi:hypothetical protein
VGLSEVQGALARLYTDRTLRERFFADPPGTGASLGLAPDEAVQLAGSRGPIEAFARSLQAKRRGDTARMLPATCRELRERFGPLFREYATGAPPNGVRKTQLDAARFAEFLAHALGADPAAQPAVELARYEAAWLQAGGPERCLLVRWFRLPVHRMIRDETAEADGQRFVGIWLRPWPNGRFRHWWLRVPCARRRIPRAGEGLKSTR